MELMEGLFEYLMPVRSIASTFARLDTHRRMLHDPVRVKVFQEAIQSVVRPGHTVVDIGTGTGILALMAIQAGARKVYAVEVTELASIAREIAEKNGAGGMIHFIHGDSREIELPEKVDVLISETLGHIGIDEGIVGTMTDARCRFLKPGGRIIPESMAIFMAPTTDRGVIENDLSAWKMPVAGFDFSPASRHAGQRVYLRRTLESEWCAAPQIAFHVNFALDAPSPFIFRSRFIAQRTATCTGLSAWFESKLGVSAHLSSRATSSWYPVFFPVDPPVDLEAFDEIDVEVNCRCVGDETAWAWTFRTNRESRRCGRGEAVSEE